MTSGLYSSLMCALGHPSAISGVARAASEDTFHPFLAKKPHAVQEKKKKKRHHVQPAPQFRKKSEFEGGLRDSCSSRR